MARGAGDTLLSAEEVQSAADPAALLDFVWAMEPALRIADRSAGLDRLSEIIDLGIAPPPPPGRDWAMELLAERAFDAAAYVRLKEGQDLANRVLAEAGTDAKIARARATLALGRALAWVGTAEATRRGDARLREAIELFRLLEHIDWLGFTLFWRGHAICYQNGELAQAAELIGEGLDVLGPDSLRRASILTFYADVLTELGLLDAADAALHDAASAAERDGFPRSRSYVAWSRFRLSASRDEPAETLRLIREAEADAGDWFATMAGLDFLADAATQLDRVGLRSDADRYLERARERVAREGSTTADGTQVDEPLRLAEASLIARSGDPREALALLAELVRGNWLEKRLTWRNTLLTAWATLRAGAREDAAPMAARALLEAANSGGVRVALAGEEIITRALLPLADEAGSPHARSLLGPEKGYAIRLFGVASIRTPGGEEIRLPPGKPGELVRWLALHPHGLAADRVIAAFFPDTERTTGLQRLRQVLRRVRAEAGDLVQREHEQLTLAPAWVDIREFTALTQRAQDARGGRRDELAWAALALAGRGPLLSAEPYAEWAEAVREVTAERILAMSAIIAAGAQAPQSGRRGR